MALEQDGEAMEFVSDRLRDNKDIMLLAIKSAPWTACYASERLKGIEMSSWKVLKLMVKHYIMRVRT